MLLGAAVVQATPAVISPVQCCWHTHKPRLASSVAAAPRVESTALFQLRTMRARVLGPKKSSSSALRCDATVRPYFPEMLAVPLHNERWMEMYVRAATPRPAEKEKIRWDVRLAGRGMSAMCEVWGGNPVQRVP